MKSTSIPSPEETVTRQVEEPPAPECEPLRSLVFVSLVAVTILTAIVDTNLFHQTGVSWYATFLATVALSPIALLSTIHVLAFSQMEDSTALNVNLRLSRLFYRFLCIGILFSRPLGPGLTVRDFFFCWELVSMIDAHLQHVLSGLDVRGCLLKR